MRKLIVLMTLALVALPLLAADPAEEAKQAEIAFAKAFADRDADRFFSFVADDAHFLNGKRTLSGREAVREVWSKYLEGAAPFSWKPERVLSSSAGDIALSTGPVFDPQGNHIGDFSSIWRKQADGSWKVIFDGPGSPVCKPEKALEKKE